METHKDNIANKITTSLEPNIYNEKYIKKASEKLYAYIYLENSDMTKYESIFKSLNHQYSFGNNQYLTSITEASNILNSHKSDGNYTKYRHGQKNQNSKDKGNTEEHEEPLSSTFTQIEGKCCCCDKSGHKAPQYKYKSTKLRSEWFTNNVLLTQNKIESSSNNNSSTDSTKDISIYSRDSTITSKSSPKQIGWTNLHYNLSHYDLNQSNMMHKLVLLDSYSINTIFCNKDYVCNIQKAKNPLEIQTNGGTMIVKEICETTHLGTHCFNKEAITNIIILVDMCKIFRVTMDTAKE